MANTNDKSGVADALDSLRKHRQFFEFDDQERVVKVCISDASNGDELAAHVGNFRYLEKLRFSKTSLTDCGLHHLLALTQLRELCIDGVDGSMITPVGLGHLSSMSHLEYLYIEDARNLDLAGFHCIARLRSLRKLKLCGGRFSDADLAPLTALVNLEELSLSECNQLQGTFCKYLIDLSRFRRLSLGQQASDQGLRSIGRLLTLNELFLTGPFTDVGMETLIELKNLTTFSVVSDRITANGVAMAAELPKLDHFYLDTLPLADDIVAPLIGCSVLEWMVFTRSALSDAALQELRDGLPKCLIEDLQRDRDEFGPRAETKDTVGPRFEQETPFLTLLSKAGDWDLVNGTFHKIGERYDNWVDATQYSPEESVVMLVWHSSGIIDNGGLEYLFASDFPGDPDFRITANAYKTAGLLRGYEAFQEAFALFPGGKIPRERGERNQLYQAANRSARYRLNRKLWQDGRDGTCEKKLAEFVRKNAARLGNLDAAP
jgi:hypothetical protein